MWWGVGQLLQLCHVKGTFKWENVCWLSWQAPSDRYEHQQEGMALVIKTQEILFSTADNIHSILINAKSQVMLQLVNPITLSTLETTLYVDRLQSNHTPGDVIVGDMEWSRSHAKEPIRWHHEWI